MSSSTRRTWEPDDPEEWWRTEADYSRVKAALLISRLLQSGYDRVIVGKTEVQQGTDFPSGRHYYQVGTSTQTSDGGFSYSDKSPRYYNPADAAIEAAKRIADEFGRSPEPPLQRAIKGKKQTVRHWWFYPRPDSL